MVQKSLAGFLESVLAYPPQAAPREAKKGTFEGFQPLQVVVYTGRGFGGFYDRFSHSPAHRAA